MEADADRFADEKGRDAFAFDPIESQYLGAAAAGFRIRTPYSRSLVQEIREIPHARWDADHRLWTVPYRSIEDLRQRWPAIEAAAERSEPEARKARREALKGTPEDETARARSRERRLKRYPVLVDDCPPTERAIGTRVGIVFFQGTDGELAEPVTINTFYFLTEEGATWRSGSLEELVTTWPARTSPNARELERGWRMPTLDELRVARRDARSCGAGKPQRAWTSCLRPSVVLRRIGPHSLGFIW
jgi:hypothetical protein